MQSKSQWTFGEVGAVVRGALAEPSGDEDRPWLRPEVFGNPHSSDEPIVVSEYTPTEPEGVERVFMDVPTPERPVLKLPPIPSGETQSSWPDDVYRSISKYRERCGGPPPVLFLPGLGQIHVSQPAAAGERPLHNRVALITGAAGAIGHGICRGLGEAGAFLAATDLAAGLPALANDLVAMDLDACWETIEMDVTDAASVARAFEAAAVRRGGVDLVVINAGIAHVAPLTELPLETFQKLEKVNVEGTLLTLTEAARWMKLQGTGGDIVLISTKNVPSPSANFGAYSATKAAAHQLARIASLELAPFDIRVNMVAPDGVFSDDGGVKSGLWATVGPDRMKARGLDEAGLEDYYRQRNLLKTRVTARHVANAVLFFATRQTPTTGATIPVDGGLPDATPR